MLRQSIPGASWTIQFNPETSARHKFEYWMAVEQCLPGTMQLIPVYSAGGNIVDLVCAAASRSMPRILSDNRAEAAGKRLSVLLSYHQNLQEVLATYIDVVRTGESRSFRAERDSGERLQHRVILVRPGLVTAEVRNQSAFERAKTAYLLLKSPPPPR
jgi:hypothetical protein